MDICKYDIFLVNLNPQKWHTQSWIRPWINIQNNIFNKYSPTIIIVPLTTISKKIFPSEFLISPSNINWLTNESRVLCSQIMTLDKSFIQKKIWVLEDIYYEQLKKSISICLDLDNQF